MSENLKFMLSGPQTNHIGTLAWKSPSVSLLSECIWFGCYQETIPKALRSLRRKGAEPLSSHSAECQMAGEERHVLTVAPHLNHFPQWLFSH